jgi:hypothetical protein
MVKTISIAALIGMASLVSATTVGCVRDGTENEVTGGIQNACSSSNGLEKKECNIFGKNCDLCQTTDSSSDIPKDDEVFADTAKWCSDQGFTQDDKHFSYSLKGFARV